jgi:hypothetical protein
MARVRDQHGSVERLRLGVIRSLMMRDCGAQYFDGVPHAQNIGQPRKRRMKTTVPVRWRPIVSRRNGLPARQP